MQRAMGNRSTARLIQRANGSDGVGGDPKRRLLAEQAKNEIKTFGGLSVAVYLRNEKVREPEPPPGLKGEALEKFKKEKRGEWSNEEEFKRQADRYAKDHGSFGVTKGDLKRGKAMVIDADVVDLMKGVSEQAEALLDEFPDLYDESDQRPEVKIQTLSVFTHGQKKRIKAGATGNRQVSPLKFVKNMAPLLTAAPRINLYACKAAGPVEVGEENFATQVQEALTEELANIYGESFVEVWGHTTSAHTTFNPNLAVVGPSGLIDMHDLFSGRLVDMVADEMGMTLNDEQREKLQEAARKAIENTFKVVKLPGDPIAPTKTNKGEEQKKFTGMRNPLQVYFREITMLGYERVWDDLTADSDPTDYKDLGMIDVANDRMVKGIAYFRKRFRNNVAAFEKKIPEIIGETPAKPPSSGKLTEEEAHSAIKYNKDRGYKTGQVEKIQHTVGVNPTGFFEPPTVLAVAHWQDSRDLDDDGKVGPNTHREMLGTGDQPSQQEPEKKSEKKKDDSWWSKLGLPSWDDIKNLFS